MKTKSSTGRSPRYQPTITFVKDSPERSPRLDINVARATELIRVPGITKAIAQRIVQARKKRKFVHVDDLVTNEVLTVQLFARLRTQIKAEVNDHPYIYAVTSDPKHILYRRPFRLDVLFEDSASGARLIRLQADSVSHGLDLTREVTAEDRSRGAVTFDMPPMEAGIINLQVTLYDDAGNKDYLACTLPIFHNPASVTFYPSERSLRLSNGAALLKSDGKFHCDSAFFFFSYLGTSTTLNRVVTWRILNQSGGLLESGTWDYGSNIVLGPWEISTGWWFHFDFPPGNVTFNRLHAKQSVRIEWQFTDVATGAIVSSDLTWRTVLGPNVNIIRVGEENFTDADRTLIFDALRNSVSSLYQQQDLDIGTIETRIISVAQAGGQITINNDDEAEDLTDDWTANNNSMDMFVVLTFVGSTAGLSAVGGSCDKDAKGMTGSVVELQSSQQLLGIIMAHELAHYLGLGHTGAANNVMNASVGTGNTVLTVGQGNTMKGHCFIRFLG